MTEYRFRCLGPFYFSTYKDKRGLRTIKHFEARDEVFQQAEAIAHKVGVKDIYSTVGLYVMGLSPSGSSVTWPYYVGRASRQTLHARLFQAQDKPKKYAGILSEYQRARPFIYLFPMLTTAGNQVKVTKQGTKVFKTISEAEYMMIGHAMNVNPWLHNVQNVVSLNRFSIDGTPQADKRETIHAKEFRTMMGFDFGEVRSESVREASIEAFEQEDARSKLLADTSPSDLSLATSAST
ncbi:hypothetical protein KUW17_22935 [Leisingera aquaemixtae]|uniref:hypothetical protein n=1 Tax=Leisingera aquaemixtae TaxID=1396826 RepID=UPI001C96D93E|nr:hypothetical protein [Leisingera aquaemixtae]MBY6069610.1 hypothetical protein [Leisingera aquaemixtae]